MKNIPTESVNMTNSFFVNTGKQLAYQLHSNTSNDPPVVLDKVGLAM